MARNTFSKKDVLQNQNKVSKKINVFFSKKTFQKTSFWKHFKFSFILSVRSRILPCGVITRSYHLTNMIVQCLLTAVPNTF